MVSVLKRQLSVLLVATIATSWLVLPIDQNGTIQAADSSATTSSATEPCSSGYHGDTNPELDATTQIFNFSSGDVS